MTLTPSRQGLIDNKKVAIYDGLLSKKECLALEVAFKNAAFVKKEVARPDTQHTPHWALNLTESEFKSIPLFEKTMLAINNFKPEGSQYHPYRYYCNHASFGDTLFSHTDCSPNATELTALWFIANRWDHEWGGETLFFNEKNDAEFVCSPRPGRLVIFDGRIKHAGRAPMRNCPEPRYTFAVKLEQR